MPSFSKVSKQRLDTCDARIQRVMNKVITETDCMITCGYRPKEEQLALFKQGRSLIDGKWVKTGKTVTNLDGYKKVGRHNTYPSGAIDVIPYPVDWTNIKAFKDLAEVIKRVALEEGVELEWGGDWQSFVDYPHWQIKK